MKKIYVIHSRSFDYEGEIYSPLMKIPNFEFVFPHLKENEHVNSKDSIRGCDLVLADVSHPSIGAGIEIGRAEASGKPIIAIYKSGSKISSSLKFVTDNFVEYEDLEKDFDGIRDLINNVTESKK
ncbi:MAG: hypothetical protein UX75_C0062G0006 [Candidatus Moranbacteria bacterium GW2011_GWE2_47_10]|nr:MAG: hypothetical protein UX75_C0062G0006 [Candidatus Moranbacteria bacterium GW2011_GWE2_47_10]